MRTIKDNDSLTLKDIRNLKGWTVEKTAERCNLMKTTYARVDQGLAEPRLSTLMSIAKGFDITIDEAAAAITNQLNERRQMNEEVGRESNS